MRLIGTIESEKKAFIIYSVLLKEGIHSTYERECGENNDSRVAIWIYEEDQVERATHILNTYKESPGDPRYTKIQLSHTPPQPPDAIAHSRAKGSQDDVSTPPWNTRVKAGHSKSRHSFPLTYCIILLCACLYLWNLRQQKTITDQSGPLAAHAGMTPLERILMFDYPKSSQEIDTLLKRHPLKEVESLNDLPAHKLQSFEEAARIPTFQGFLPQLLPWLKRGPLPAHPQSLLFMKIRQGELWRLFTPCLLHAGPLHILFNMAWAWFLLKQVELRLSKIKSIVLLLLIGIVSNTAQYLVSGPYFLGFSAIVVGLIGFIWVRQKEAPWEGYPLQKSTFLFMVVFVLAMSALEIFSIFTAAITTMQISVNIANTAHIIGGITGALLGRLPFFSRNVK